MLTLVSGFIWHTGVSPLLCTMRTRVGVGGGGWSMLLGQCLGQYIKASLVLRASWCLVQVGGLSRYTDGEQTSCSVERRSWLYNFQCWKKKLVVMQLQPKHHICQATSVQIPAELTPTGSLRLSPRGRDDTALIQQIVDSKSHIADNHNCLCVLSPPDGRNCNPNLHPCI